MVHHAGLASISNYYYLDILYLADSFTMSLGPTPICLGGTYGLVPLFGSSLLGFFSVGLRLVLLCDG